MSLVHLFADDILAHRQATKDPAGETERERVARLGERAARSWMPVLIESEPGSGAAALARAIHECGERRGRPFLRLLPGEASAGSGATLAKRLKEAAGGTLLVSDVDHLSAESQRQLLDAVHAREPAPRGRRGMPQSDVRFIATTGFGLSERVRDGSFREDLFYRLQTLPIILRPLRAQPEALAEWAERLAIRFAIEEGKRITGLTSAAAALLARYDWPGNLRQLENVVYRAVVLAEGPCLTPAEFPQIAAHVQGSRIEIPPVPTARRLAPCPETAPVQRPDSHTLALIGEQGEVRTLADLEAQAIRFALVHYQGHVSAISRHLGIGRSTLYRKLKELGLDHAAA